MLHLLQMGPFRCLLLSFSEFRTLGSSHFWSFPLAASLLFLEITLWLPPRIPPACILPLFNLTPSANGALSPHPRLQTSYPSSAHYVFFPSALSSPPHASGCLSTPPASSSPLTPSGFCNGMLEVFEPEALICYTFFRFILLTLFVSRNPILTHLPRSGFRDSLLYVLIAPTPGLTFSLLMLAAASWFSSGRGYPFLNFLPPLFLRLTPIWLYRGQSL